jgi:acyl-CoA thioesterase
MSGLNSTNVPGYQEIAASMHASDKGWVAPLHAGWKQGRTAYGGLSTALALEAVYRDYSDLPPLRSATINFIGPVSADPAYKTTLLRKGRNVTMIEVKGFVEGHPVISVTFSFGFSRESQLNIGLEAPESKDPDDCEPFTPEFARDFVPKFFHNFDTRLIAGARPMSGAERGYIRTWSRHQDKASREGIASLLCLADVLPPAALPMFKQMGPVSSMTWIFNVLQDDSKTEDGWWHVETDLTAAQGGYASQVMRIWNTEGELVVEGVQSVAIFV